jgi:hypothetical protein
MKPATMYIIVVLQVNKKSVVNFLLLDFTQHCNVEHQLTSVGNLVTVCFSSLQLQWNQLREHQNYIKKRATFFFFDKIFEQTSFLYGLSLFLTVLVRSSLPFSPN